MYETKKLYHTFCKLMMFFSLLRAGFPMPMFKASLLLFAMPGDQ
jgi:hypothetical protein